MRGLAGKRVLISGGSSGIGLAAARRFLEEDCHVFVAGLDAAQVSHAVAGLRDLGDVAGTSCDVSRETDVADLTEAAWRALGGVDVLINNAGTASRQPFLQITPAQWDRVLAVNLRGMFLVARAVAARMTEQGRGGVIVNMSSTNGIAGEEDYAHYNASKGGVLLLTKTMAVELGRQGIRVNALCPGFISTPLNAAIDGRPRRPRVRGRIRPAADPARPARPGRGGGRGIRVPRLRRRLVHPWHRPGHRRRPARGDVTPGSGDVARIRRTCARRPPRGTRRR